MKPSTVRYAGTFRFRDRPMLERALARARARIDDEQALPALEGGWLRCFVMFDVTLTVDIALPALSHDRDAAAELFALLSHDAVEGSLTASIGNVPVEHYAVKPHY